MRKIGIENFGGYFDADEVAQSGSNSVVIPQKTPQQLAEQYQAGEIEIVDVRGLSERHEASIPGSKHSFLGKLLDNAHQFSGEKT